MKKLKWTEILAVVGSLLLILAVVSAVFSSDDIRDPNQPRKIVMPKEVQEPVKVKYKCPIHGITEVTITMEVDELQKIYCKKCAMKLIVDFFDLNLPKLEVVK